MLASRNGTAEIARRCFARVSTGGAGLAAAQRAREKSRESSIFTVDGTRRAALWAD